MSLEDWTEVTYIEFGGQDKVHQKIIGRRYVCDAFTVGYRYDDPGSFFVYIKPTEPPVTDDQFDELQKGTREALGQQANDKALCQIASIFHTVLERQKQ